MTTHKPVHRPITQVAKDQFGNYHLLVDGEVTSVGGLDEGCSAADVVLAAHRCYGKLSLAGGVRRIRVEERVEAVEEEPPVEKGAVVPLAALEGKISQIKNLLADGKLDQWLDELLEAERAGKARVGVLTAMEDRKGGL